MKSPWRRLICEMSRRPFFVIGYFLMEPAIVFEDDDILALNKPSGMLVHGAEGMGPEERVGSTIADWVLARYPEMAEVGEPMMTAKGTPIPRPGIVHRLDKDTSGILVLAKTQPVFEFLKTEFQEREISKEYKAIVYGEVKDDSGEINLPIGRSTEDFRRKSTLPTARGEKREALTRFKTLARGEGMSFLSVFPKTGRTHQIRVHLKAIGHPVVCDPLYAEKRPCPLEMGRLALHAFAIELALPDGRRLRLEAPLAEDMRRFATKHFPGLHFQE